MPTKHEAYANPWMTTNIFKNCLMQLNAKLGATNHKNLALHCSVFCSAKEHNISQEHQKYIFPS
jgi:hypothetical protein